MHAPGSVRIAGVRRRDRRLPALGLAVLAVAAVSGCGGGSASSDPAASPGERLFLDTGCGSCHAFGPAGTAGSAGPSLDDSQLTPAAAAAVIRAGAAGMPAYEDGLTPAEIAQLARFVTSG